MDEQHGVVCSDDGRAPGRPGKIVELDEFTEGMFSYIKEALKPARTSGGACTRDSSARLREGRAIASSAHFPSLPRPVDATR